MLEYEMANPGQESSSQEEANEEAEEVDAVIDARVAGASTPKRE
jgi:hypothetical protein